LNPLSRKVENNRKMSIVGVLLGICIIAVVLVAYGQISILQRNAGALEADKTALQEENTDLLSQITTLEAQKATLQQQVTTLQTNINSLTAQATNLQTNITSLQNQVNQLQGNNADMQAELLALYGHVNHLELRTWTEHLLVRQKPHIV